MLLKAISAYLFNDVITHVKFVNTGLVWHVVRTKMADITHDALTKLQALSFIFAEKYDYLIRILN